MQLQQLFAPRRPLREGAIKGDARKLAAQVQLVLFAVCGVVQDAVDVVEDVRAADGVVLVVRAKLSQAPVGDVLEPVPGFVIAVKRGFRESRLT